MDRKPDQVHVGLSQVFLFPLRSLLEQLKKLQAIVVQSTSKSAQTGTCIAVSPDLQLQGGLWLWQRGLWGEVSVRRSMALSLISSTIQSSGPQFPCL